MKVGEIIAYNLEKVRMERNLSLSQLAGMAGVSKVVLSQIEKGDSNPTINTIWKITEALGLPYTSLLETPVSSVELVHKEDIAELVEEKYHILPYYTQGNQRDFEIYQIVMEPGCVHASVGHPAGSEEYIMVIGGRMTLRVEDAEYHLGKDDALSFEASSPHEYRNEENADAKAVMVIQY